MKFFYKTLSLIFLFSLSIALFADEKTTTTILAFGDGGTGTQIQYDVARSMKRVCSKVGCDFGLLLGDNIYEHGVDSIDDQQFIEKFEAPYGPLEIPFYTILGNHDKRGNIQAQIDYTKRSNWWRMPEKYYSKEIGNILLVGIYSNDFDDKQKEFVKKALEKSKAQWKIVFGHHPVKSYGFHGGTHRLRKKLLPLLCESNAIYISGHDHDLQVLKSDCGTPLIVSGAAAKKRTTREGSGTLFAKSTYGYAVMSFDKKKMDLTLYNINNEILYKNSYGDLGEKNNVYFKPLREGEYAECDSKDVLFGVRYKNRGDDHTSGIYCLNSEENSSIVGKGPLHETSDLDERVYDVSCSSYDEAIVQVSSTKGKDRYIKNFACQKRENLKTNKKYYIKVDSTFGRHKEAKCKSPYDAVIGFKFDNLFDRHIEGIFCQ